ncbi:hypothetical protein AURDEDRAFT_161627 [Auricularia subglabra TFB-10046 SS5]|nr:hypothetical protein AURDEDRAFT_161627 [Auricularia subglabra TFB-10046 SS5]
MPKAASVKTSAAKKATTGSSAALAIPGHTSATKKAGTRKKDVVPVKPKTAAGPAAPKAKPAKPRATILKAPPKGMFLVLFWFVESDTESEVPPAAGADSDNDSDADKFYDGLSDKATSGTDEPPVHMRELAVELNDDSSDQDMDEEADGEDDEDAMEITAPPGKHKRKPDAKLSSSAPHPLSKATNARAGPIIPQTPVKGGAAGGAVPEPQYTPYVNKVNEKDHSKPLVSQQTPTTRHILKGAQHLQRANIVAKNAFPDDDAREEDCERFVIRIAKGLDAKRRILRFELDSTYHENMIKMVARAGTQVRGETANAARDLVGPQYALGQAKGTVEENKRFVEFLVSNGNFLYRKLEWEVVDNKTIRCTGRSGPYRHPIIPALIEQEFFHGHERMAVAEETAALFNPIPIAVIAFAATAAQCALRDWTSGVRVKSSSSFSADEWTGMYQGHVRELERMQEAKPVEVDAWLRSVWKKAWRTTRQHLSGNTADTSFITAAEMDDFSDIIDDA